MLLDCIVYVVFFFLKKARNYMIKWNMGYIKIQLYDELIYFLISCFQCKVLQEME